jgi:hypothetical protein
MEVRITQKSRKELEESLGVFLKFDVQTGTCAWSRARTKFALSCPHSGKYRSGINSLEALHILQHWRDVAADDPH